MIRVFSDFQTGIGAAAHVTLDTEQLISDAIAALVDTNVSVQGSDCGLIAFSGVLVLLIKIHDILYSAMYKQVGIMAHVLALLFSFHFQEAL